MSLNSFAFLKGDDSPPSERSALVLARWSRLAVDFARLPLRIERMRDVGELLLLGHDDALSDAERYVVEGHTSRTGHIVECDDVDDLRALDRAVQELERATAAGWGPPAPAGFWASFLRWRTPIGMWRLTERHPTPRRA
jgi:hypothetical protein